MVKNYTGDRLNFGLAAELATAEGIPTEVVVVADDVALRDIVADERRRGIAGTVLVHKIIGGAVAMGLSAQEAAAIGRRACAGLGTTGVGLGSCVIPSVGKPSFELGDDEIELGMGIHGEPGIGRGPLQRADQLVETMLDLIILDRKLEEGARVALLVNGLSGTTPLELAIVSRRVLAYSRVRGLQVERVYAGAYLTALNMPGCSISVMELDDELLDALDMPTTCRNWASDGRIAVERSILVRPAVAPDIGSPAPGPQSDLFRRVLRSISDRLESAEDELAELDGRAGDGDLGASMRRGAQAIRSLPDSAFATPTAMLRAIADTLRRSIAGSSGPFYAAGLARAALHLEGKLWPDAADWQGAFAAAVSAVEKLGGAKAGDRTMIDALRPAAAVWGGALANSLPRTAFVEAVAAAEEGAAATSSMMPRLGRASYLGERALGVPDGGAVAVTLWMKAIGDVLQAEPQSHKDPV